MKILALRIQPIIDEVIADKQFMCTGSKGILDELRVIRSLIIASEEDQDAAFGLLSLDFRRAFDSMGHEYLWAVLRKMNFPSQLISVLRNVYRQASSKLIVNGELTDPFEIRRSVRQGCTLSMILFVLGLTPLLQDLGRGRRCQHSTYRSRLS